MPFTHEPCEHAAWHGICGGGGCAPPVLLPVVLPAGGGGGAGGGIALCTNERAMRVKSNKQANKKLTIHTAGEKHAVHQETLQMPLGMRTYRVDHGMARYLLVGGCDSHLNADIIKDHIRVVGRVGSALPHKRRKV